MDVLCVLAQHAGLVLSRHALADRVWGSVHGSDESLTRAISLLRKAFRQAGVADLYIETIPKRGYRLTQPVSWEEEAPVEPRPNGNDDQQAAAPATANGHDVAAGLTRPLLAVLAFDNLSEDPDMAYFSDGISEEIQQAMAQGADLRVIGRGSSFQFRGAQKAAANVGALLGATHVLDGSVRRSGSRIRLTAQLVECAQETTLWSQRFDRDLGDMLDLQDELAASVAAELKVAFAPSASSNRIDAAAHELYLRGRAQLDQGFGEAGMIGALPLYEQAVAIAPRFAVAWAQLAQARGYVLRAFPEQDHVNCTRSGVLEAASTALRLDPRCGIAWLALRNLEPWAAFAEREALIDKALKAAPQDPEVLMAAANFSGRVGRVTDALHYGRRARVLDPLLPIAGFYSAAMLEMSGHYVESTEVFDELLQRFPDVEYLWKTALFNAACNRDWSRCDQLSAALRQHRPHAADGGMQMDFVTAARTGDPGFIRHQLERARARVAATGWVDFRALSMLQALGATDAVFELIDLCSFSNLLDPLAQPPGGWTNESLFFSRLGSARLMQDPRFVDFCGKLGLCDYWLASEKWPDCADHEELPYDFRGAVRAWRDTRRTGPDANDA